MSESRTIPITEETRQQLRRFVKLSGGGFGSKSRAVQVALRWARDNIVTPDPEFSGNGGQLHVYLDPPFDKISQLQLGAVLQAAFRHYWSRYTDGRLDGNGRHGVNIRLPADVIDRWSVVAFGRAHSVLDTIALGWETSVESLLAEIPALPDMRTRGLTIRARERPYLDLIDRCAEYDWDADTLIAHRMRRMG